MGDMIAWYFAGLVLAILIVIVVAIVYGAIALTLTFPHVALPIWVLVVLPVIFGGRLKS